MDQPFISGKNMNTWELFCRLSCVFVIFGGNLAISVKNNCYSTIFWLHIAKMTLDYFFVRLAFPKYSMKKIPSIHNNFWMLRCNLVIFINFDHSCGTFFFCRFFTFVLLISFCCIIISFLFFFLLVHHFQHFSSFFSTFLSELCFVGSGLKHRLTVIFQHAAWS